MPRPTAQFYKDGTGQQNKKLIFVSAEEAGQAYEFADEQQAHFAMSLLQFVISMFPKEGGENER